MQTTSGKVKLATAEEVDNMASSISGGLGGTLVGTTSAYIDKTLNVSLPVAGDYVVVKSLTFGDFGSRIGIKTNEGVTLLYKGGTGYIAASASASASAASAASATSAAAATATLNASGTSINFKSNLGNYNFNTYVNIEIYKFK